MVSQETPWTMLMYLHLLEHQEHQRNVVGAPHALKRVDVSAVSHVAAEPDAANAVERRTAKRDRQVTVEPQWTLIRRYRDAHLTREMRPNVNLAQLIMNPRPSARIVRLMRLRIYS